MLQLQRNRRHRIFVAVGPPGRGVKSEHTLCELQNIGDPEESTELLKAISARPLRAQLSEASDWSEKSLVHLREEVPTLASGKEYMLSCLSTGCVRKSKDNVQPS